MSRIGNNPVKLPPKVEVTLAAGEIKVKGPLGELPRTFGDSVTIEKDGDSLVFKAANDEARAMQGTMRALVANMVKGVTDGYSRQAARWSASAIARRPRATRSTCRSASRTRSCTRCRRA